MNQTFTPEEFITLATLDLEASMCESDLCKGKKQVSPSNNVINYILNFSSVLAVYSTKNTGAFSVILN